MGADWRQQEECEMNQWESEMSKMTVYEKLQAARMRLQNTQLKKSGHNKFAGYMYFELGDFLPAIQSIFSEVGLCGIVSYTADIATLRIIDIENGGEIVITSPMGSAALKGVHEVQNIGAVETYQRRYLWVTAMEIVEHDALDSSTGRTDAKAAPEGVNVEKFKWTIDQAKTVDGLMKIWKSIAAVCTEANDVKASDTLKAYCATRKAAILANEVTA